MIADGLCTFEVVKLDIARIAFVRMRELRLAAEKLAIACLADGVSPGGIINNIGIVKFLKAASMLHLGLILLKWRPLTGP